MKRNYVIAEIGINHNGDIDLAKELIEMAKKNDCDAVKFQKRDIESVYTEEELNQSRVSPWGTTNRQQKEGLEFSIEQYKELEKFSNDLELDFIVSCWDVKSIDLVESNLNVKYHKVASALLTDKSFLSKLNSTGKPIIISTGMSTDQEIDEALKILHNVVYVLACTSTYPTVDQEINLNYLKTLKQRYPNYKIGFSNHASGLIPCFGAVALGSECIEFHITKDRTMYGSDQAASIENVNELMSGIRKMEIVLGDGIKTVYESEKPILKKLRKVNDISIQ
jgi:N-acetylneuraminate synthase